MSVVWGPSPRGHSGVGQQEGDGSVPECWLPCGEGNLPWGPQPALPLLCHFPVCCQLVLISPLLPLEKAKLGGRGRRRTERSGKGQMGIRQQLQHKTQKVIGVRTCEVPIKSHLCFQFKCDCILLFLLKKIMLEYNRLWFVD